MASIAVSAIRFRSMLQNRHKTAEEIAGQLTTHVNLVVLAAADTEVEFEDLEAIAAFFKRPWSYLLTDEAEHFPDLGQDNRTYLNQRVPMSDEIMAELEAATLMLCAAAELFPEDGYQVPEASLSTNVAPPVAAAQIRAFLSISMDVQLAARDDYAALRLWVDALQDRGIYVSQRRLRDKTIRAFSRIQDGQALIVVDTGDTPYARNFSLLHEYCHIVLRTTGICDLDQHYQVERYCNQVAASVLLPIDLLQREITNLQFGVDDEADDKRLQRLSHHFRISQATLLIRLQEAKFIPDEMYEALEARRRTRRASPKTKGGQFYPTAINRVGRRFAHNVFGSLDDGAIDRADASVLLEVGEHLIGRYRRELFTGHGGVR